MDFARRGEALLAEAPSWIDAKRAPSLEKLAESLSSDLTASQWIQLGHLVRLYVRMPSQMPFFHGYLHHLVGETLFRDFVRFANHMA